MAKVQQKSEKTPLLAEYFSFWTINPYSEDIVKAVMDTAGQTLCVLYSANRCLSQMQR